jgi:hypothetical protein
MGVPTRYLRVARKSKPARSAASCPALRQGREGRGTHCVEQAEEVKGRATRPNGCLAKLPLWPLQGIARCSLTQPSHLRSRAFPSKRQDTSVSS